MGHIPTVRLQCPSAYRIAIREAWRLRGSNTGLNAGVLIPYELGLPRSRIANVQNPVVEMVRFLFSFYECTLTLLQALKSAAKHGESVFTMLLALSRPPL